jgi:hypothetical protein
MNCGVFVCGKIIVGPTARISLPAPLAFPHVAARLASFVHHVHVGVPAVELHRQTMAARKCEEPGLRRTRHRQLHRNRRDDLLEVAELELEQQKVARAT